MHIILSICAVLGLLIAGCDTPDVSQSNIKWGHFKELDNSDANSQKLKGAFLFQVDKGVPINACITEPLPPKTERLWLQAELLAAVNAWGYAVGRFIPLVFSACNAQSELVLTFQKPPVPGDFVGYTDFGKGALPTARTVYLNPNYSWELTADTQRWRASPDIDQLPWKKRSLFLLRQILEGNMQPQQFSKTGTDLSRSKQPIFSVLLHEIGHAWGMCDMYEDNIDGDGFHSNCSAKFCGKKATDDEIMGQATRPGKARFKLSSADVEGITALLSRADVATPKNYAPFKKGSSELSLENYLAVVEKWAQ